MFRTLLAGVAALALMTGAAVAQDNSYSQSTTTRSVDAYGNQVEQKDSVSKSQAMTPDGATTTVTRSHSSSGAVVAPAPVDRSTTTTTTIHRDDE